MLSLLEVDLHLGGLRSHIAADYDFTSQRIRIYIFLRTRIYISADYGLHLADYTITSRRTTIYISTLQIEELYIEDE